MFDIKKLCFLFIILKEEIFWEKKTCEGQKLYEILYKKRKYAGKIYKDTKLEDSLYELNIAAKIKGNLYTETHGVICFRRCYFTYGNNKLPRDV